MSPFHTDDSISYLKCKISEHKQAYLDLFPENQLLPKHFLEHDTEMIRPFRSLVLMWTMSFEAKHSYFKQVVRHTNYFKNITLTLRVNTN